MPVVPRGRRLLTFTSILRSRRSLAYVSLAHYNTLERFKELEGTAFDARAILNITQLSLVDAVKNAMAEKEKKVLPTTVAVKPGKTLVSQETLDTICKTACDLIVHMPDAEQVRLQSLFKRILTPERVQEISQDIKGDFVHALADDTLISIPSKTSQIYVGGASQAWEAITNQKRNPKRTLPLTVIITYNWTVGLTDKHDHRWGQPFDSLPQHLKKGFKKYWEETFPGEPIHGGSVYLTEYEIGKANEYAVKLLIQMAAEHDIKVVEVSYSDSQTLRLTTEKRGDKMALVATSDSGSKEVGIFEQDNLPVIHNCAEIYGKPLPARIQTAKIKTMETVSRLESIEIRELIVATTDPGLIIGTGLSVLWLIADMIEKGIKPNQLPIIASRSITAKKDLEESCTGGNAKYLDYVRMIPEGKFVALSEITELRTDDGNVFMCRTDGACVKLNTELLVNATGMRAHTSVTDAVPSELVRFPVKDFSNLGRYPIAAVQIAEIVSTLHDNVKRKFSATLEELKNIEQKLSSLPSEPIPRESVVHILKDWHEKTVRELLHIITLAKSSDISEEDSRKIDNILKIIGSVDRKVVSAPFATGSSLYKIERYRGVFLRRPISLFSIVIHLYKDYEMFASYFKLCTTKDFPHGLIERMINEIDKLHSERHIDSMPRAILEPQVSLEEKIKIFFVLLLEEFKEKEITITPEFIEGLKKFTKAQVTQQSQKDGSSHLGVTDVDAMVDLAFRNARAEIPELPDDHCVLPRRPTT